LTTSLGLFSADVARDKFIVSAFSILQPSCTQLDKTIKKLSVAMDMDFAGEDTQNSAPGQPTMVEQQKLAAPQRKADAQSVTKR
jgi:hypothetical protein